LKAQPIKYDVMSIIMGDISQENGNISLQI